MRRSISRALLVVALVTASFWACSLNPQPIPPGADELDGSFGGSSPGSPVDGPTPDAGQAPRIMDASDVSVPPPEPDGGDSGKDAVADARDD